MLRCIDTNTGHTQTDQVVQVTGNFLSYVRNGAVKVRQSNKEAVSHICCVRVIVNIAFTSTGCSLS